MRRMPAPAFTADELLRLPRGRGRHELVHGELRTMSPAGPRHGKVAARFAKILMMHVDRLRLGDVYGADTGFLLARGPDTVMAPDVAFVAAARAHLAPETGYFPGPPDLAVEVRSPGDSPAEVAAKAQKWLAHGCGVVVAVDPASRTAVVWRRLEATRALCEQDTLDCGDVVPGFTLRLSELFAD